MYYSAYKWIVRFHYQFEFYSCAARSRFDDLLLIHKGLRRSLKFSASENGLRELHCGAIHTILMHRVSRVP